MEITEVISTQGCGAMTVINYLTTIEFDFGAVTRLPDVLQECGIETPLVVTDDCLVKIGVIGDLRDRIAVLNNGATFPETPANPTEAAAIKALEVYRDAGCDGIVAIGGGSPIDLAKAVAILTTHEGPLAQYAAIEGGVAKIKPGAPVIAIPTTAGTGSEVGRAALITLSDNRKLGLISTHLIPVRAICDPELTLGLPQSLTAATGLDAISHCVETYLSPKVNPVAEAIALDGLSRAVGAINTAVQDGQNKQARWEMMMAALQGGLTFQKGLGAIHALSHPLGAVKHVSLHHGTLNAILLPHVLEKNASACSQKYARIRQCLGLSEEASLPEFFATLNADLGLPAKLSDEGVLETDLEPVAAAAILDHSAASNPIQFSAHEYLTILRDSF